uniref:Secreted protein n=1 Tax=Entomoneis paludosa TaxID=265537 RepID=A0A7S2YS83_9STRA|mmetsp:Transcript_7494/g.15646  ORF Transcript_7494/g.15646 Transcript_7494/m.15646 type:complete len:114 (+) Transcript_7494:116-457(+)
MQTTGFTAIFFLCILVHDVNHELQRISTKLNFFRKPPRCRRQLPSSWTIVHSTISALDSTHSAKVLYSAKGGVVDNRQYRNRTTSTWAFAVPPFVPVIAPQSLYRLVNDAMPC